MTLFALRTRDDLLAVHFAVSPLWETQAAVQALADQRARSYHKPAVSSARAQASDRGSGFALVRPDGILAARGSARPILGSLAPVVVCGRFPG